MREQGGIVLLLFYCPGGDGHAAGYNCIKLIISVYFNVSKSLILSLLKSHYYLRSDAIAGPYGVLSGQGLFQ